MLHYRTITAADDAPGGGLGQRGRLWTALSGDTQQPDNGHEALWKAGISRDRKAKHGPPRDDGPFLPEEGIPVKSNQQKSPKQQAAHVMWPAALEIFVWEKVQWNTTFFDICKKFEMKCKHLQFRVEVWHRMQTMIGSKLGVVCRWKTQSVGLTHILRSEAMFLRCQPGAFCLPWLPSFRRYRSGWDFRRAMI